MRNKMFARFTCMVFIRIYIEILEAFDNYYYILKFVLNPIELKTRRVTYVFKTLSEL